MVCVDTSPPPAVQPTTMSDRIRHYKHNCGSCATQPASIMAIPVTPLLGRHARLGHHPKPDPGALDLPLSPLAIRCPDKSRPLATASLRCSQSDPWCQCAAPC